MELRENGHPARDYDPDARPEGFEDNTNTVAEDSEEVDLAKDQEPELDDSDLEDEDDEELDLSGPATEGA